MRIFLSFTLLVLLVFVLTPLAFADERVEIFSWWTGGGEEEGLLALLEFFSANYPDLELINATVAGGAGTNAKAVLKTRMVGGNPPDSFQVHGGAELIDTYVKTGLMQPITDILQEWGIKDKFNQQILELCSYQGELYAIPVNVHRGNVLWYNKALLAQYDLEEPTNLYTFVTALKQLAEQGVTPLALGDKNKWTATHLFECIMVATLGATKYNGLWDGTTSFNDPGIREALVVFGEIINYVNEDHAALTWQDASERVFSGKAVFNVMGDWAEGYFKTMGWTPGQEFGWIAVPGTRGSFMVITDCFGLPKGAPNPDGAKAWLKTIASVEGQDIFNPIKGSIPSRLDADQELYDPYLTDSMHDFTTAALTPSIAHGSAAPEGFITALHDALNQFITERDVEQTLHRIKKAAADFL